MIRLFRNLIANPISIFPNFWSTQGAISMERMDFVLWIDYFMSIPSREWTVFSPMERIFKSSVQFHLSSVSPGRPTDELTRLR